MATFGELRQGDRVRHKNELVGLGIVAVKSPDEIQVIYDMRSEKSGENFRGIYDVRWFDICGELLEKVERGKK